MKTIRQIAAVAGILATALVGAPLHAEHSCTSPLVLDLNGDGTIRTTGSNHPVLFDINADGFPEWVQWTFWEDGDGFLVLDRNENGVVDDGGEMFGNVTLLPTGELASEGFEALAVYDRPDHGGNGDAIISADDAIWRELRIWVDRNHDGTSQPSELSPLARFGIVAIGLEARRTDVVDGNGNGHYVQGFYLRRVVNSRRVEFREFVVHDVFFKVLHQD